MRRRVFRHFQVLSPAFHDGYTSGRVISRQTSDVDAIYEMLETGFDGLVTAALTLVGTAGLLLFLDVKLGLVALTCGPFLAWLTLWFRRESAQVLQGHPREGRAGHRPLRRVDGRDPRGAGVPPRAPQPGDLRRRQRPVPPRQPGRVPAGRVVHARHPADRQRHHRRRAALRRLPRLPRRRHRRRAGGVPALPAPVLRADDGDLAVLQHLPVRLGGARQAGRRPRGGAVGARARPTRSRSAAARRRAALRPRRLRVRRGPHGAARPRPDRPGRPDAGPGRHHRRRQDDAGQAGHPVLRPDRGPGAARRHRPARPALRRTCATRS